MWGNGHRSEEIFLTLYIIFGFDFGCEAGEKSMMLDGNFIHTLSFYQNILNISIVLRWQYWEAEER